MSPPTVRVNTFVKESERLQVDPISQMFILMEFILGLDRLPLMGKGKFVYVFTTFIISLTINTTAIAMNMSRLTVVIWFVPIGWNIIISLLSFLRCKWMQSFYAELIKFDAEASCTPKVSLASIRNVVFCLLIIIFVLVLFVVPVIIDFQVQYILSLTPLYIVYILEVFYFGHLLSLLIPRLKLINYYLKSSLSCTNTEPSSIVKEFVYFNSYDPEIAQNSMKKLMDLYEIVVEAYDCLIEGIKWQLLSIIISAFINILGFLFRFSFDTIHGGVLKKDALFQIAVPIILLIPLFAPCLFGDSVQSEVRKLRELLASRLYENKLDKSGRSTARALLAFTETRDLSFRLLRMLNIDISLPFKFVGLLVTYLIILLQFEKVINPK